MKNIGIVCEGPTDYILLKEVIDEITARDNRYVLLQPEPDLTGQYGNGWKGVWKWCLDHALIKEPFMKGIDPALDILVIQMDGDVSRKEKAVHCFCQSALCQYKDVFNPIECDMKKQVRESCPIVLPCTEHDGSVKSYMEHLENLISMWLLHNLHDTCIVIPCDSTESWVLAAYDGNKDAEKIEDPWKNVISRKKYYHGIRVSGSKKSTHIYRQFAEVVCANWEQVSQLCLSAKKFEDAIIALTS